MKMGDIPYNIPLAEKHFTQADKISLPGGDPVFHLLLLPLAFPYYNNKIYPKKATFLKLYRVQTEKSTIFTMAFRLFRL
jgi:hypothetical protein